MIRFSQPEPATATSYQVLIDGVGHFDLEGWVEVSPGVFEAFVPWPPPFVYTIRGYTADGRAGEWSQWGQASPRPHPADLDRDGGLSLRDWSLCQDAFRAW